MLHDEVCILLRVPEDFSGVLQMQGLNRSRSSTSMHTLCELTILRTHLGFLPFTIAFLTHTV
jgi:hypothetical protein